MMKIEDRKVSQFLARCALAAQAEGDHATALELWERARVWLRTSL